MKFIPDPNQKLQVRDFILQTTQTLQSLRAAYSKLIFEQIAEMIIHINIPEGAEDELKLLENQINALTVPVLYGLNAEEALSEANILMFHQYPFGSLRGEGIIIGFADTGIDYTNKIFKNKDNTTRILSIWDQTIEGNPPEGYTYGTQYTEADINRALNSENPYDIVPSKDEIGHGTLLAGAAAGDDKTGGNEYVGGAPDASVMMVKLKPASSDLKTYYLVEQTAIAYQGNDIITGINYLLKTALKLQKPLVICLGLGSNYGAHDGTSIIERYLNTLTAVQNLVVVAAGGNEANSAKHFRGSVTEGQKEDIEINVSVEEDKGFWTFLWANIADKLAVSIRSPIGQMIEKVPVASNQAKTNTFSLEKTKITINYNYPDAQTGAENIDIRFQNPTPGLWTITVYGEKIVDGVYDIWLQRTGFTTENTRFLKPDTLVTVTIPSTSEYVITVGAYNYLDQSIYVGSGRGPMADGRIKPELVAPGVNIRGPASGGGYTTYTGTSAAAAITAAASALLMQWTIQTGSLKEMNTRIVRDILIRGARRSEGIEYPNPIEGYGKLDLRAAIANIK